MTLVATGASPAPEDQDQALVEGAPVVADAGAPVTDANAAAPSPVDVQDAKPPVDLLSVIKNAVEKPKEPEASSAPESGQVDPAAVEPAAVVEPTAEDDANLPFHNHPRWKAVLADRDALREPAEQYGKITTFMETHGLVADEVAEGFSIMAALKSGDPAKLAETREWFASRLQVLDGALGNVLPEDLQTRINEGLIDEESAREIAQSRAATTLRANQDTDREKRTAEATRESEAKTAGAAMVSAVEGWETRTKASDPDYSKKAGLVETTCRAIVQRTGKAPTNAEEAVALADQALAEVNAQFKSLLPKPRAIAPGPTGASTVAATAPTTLRQAVEAGLARSN